MTKRNFIRSVGALAFASILVLTGCTAGGNGNNTSENPTSSSFENDGCVHLTIATSSEKVNLMEELATAFKSSPEHEALAECVTIKPINVSSGDGTTILASNPDTWPLADEEYWPSLWSPASTIWTDRVAAAGNSNLVSGAESFTHTPVVFAMPESMAKALDYPNTPISLNKLEELIVSPDGWGSVGKPLWGDFKISKTNPNTSTTGLSTILMQSYAASGKTDGLTVDDVAAAEEFSRNFELGAIHYGDTTGKILTTLYNESNKSNGTGSSYVSAIAVEETSLINYNLGNPDSHTVQPGETLTPPREKLVAIYPEGGSLWSDNPIAVLNAPWVTAEKKEASEAFATFLQTKPAQEILPKYGFRPLDTSVDLGELFTPKNGIQPDQPAVSLPKPDPAVVSAAIDQWEDIRKPSAVIELVDISGSMDESIGDGRSRLDGAIAGVQDTVGHFRSSDYVGVWAFTTGVESEIGQNIVPLRDFEPLGSDKEQLSNAVEDLKNAQKGGTPLYDSISSAYDYMTERAESGRINAIVVLSDGDDTDSRTSLDSLIVKLNESNAGEGNNSAQVRIFPIAYGEGANMDALKRIADASGGQVFDATDPEKIDRVFAQVINNF